MQSAEPNDTRPRKQDQRMHAHTHGLSLSLCSPVSAIRKLFPLLPPPLCPRTRWKRDTHARIAANPRPRPKLRIPSDPAIHPLWKLQASARTLSPLSLAQGFTADLASSFSHASSLSPVLSVSSSSHSFTSSRPHGIHSGKDSIVLLCHCTVVQVGQRPCGL
jgi:hypothetical protein